MGRFVVVMHTCREGRVIRSWTQKATEAQVQDEAFLMMLCLQVDNDERHQSGTEQVTVVHQIVKL